MAVDLIVFPGGSSPNSIKYIPVYGLIKEQAHRRGYDKVITLTFPGQIDEKGDIEGEMTLESSVEKARAILYQYEKEQKHYDILARSGGTFVAVRCAIDYDFSYLRKLILWGIPPYWSCWKYCKSELDSFAERLRQGGCKMTESYFPSIFPVEAELSKIPYKTIIATGTLDTSSPPGFMEYMKTIAGYSKNIEFRLVQDVAHSVTKKDDGWEEYISALFD